MRKVKFQIAGHFTVSTYVALFHLEHDILVSKSRQPPSLILSMHICPLINA